MRNFVHLIRISGRTGESNESRREWMLNRFEYAGKNDDKIKNYHFWQQGNDAQEIYLNDYFNQKLNYIHENPVKAESKPCRRLSV
ncbi:MAG: hypothetical protein WBI53_06395 [Paludibacter sp.]